MRFISETFNPAVDRNCSRINPNVLSAALSGLRWWLGGNLGRRRLAFDEHRILAHGAVLFAFPNMGGSVAVDRIVLHRCDTSLRSAILSRARRYMERPRTGRTRRFWGVGTSPKADRRAEMTRIRPSAMGVLAVLILLC